MPEDSAIAAHGPIFSARGLTKTYQMRKGLLRRVDGVGTPDEVKARITATLAN